MNIFTGSYKYINEGNVHIVVQKVGTNTVLRLLKADHNKYDVKCGKNSVEFVNRIMLPLLGLYRNCDLEIVDLSAELLGALSNHLMPFRPLKRRHKCELRDFAIEAPNLTLLDLSCKNNYCVEIKPKEGFLSPSFKSIRKCHYCLKQYMKFKSNEVIAISNYCPLDLFSGNRFRMKRAFYSLLCNPQNNLKMFLNGELVFGDKGNIDSFQTLLKNIDVFSHTDDFIDFLINSLCSLNNAESSIISNETLGISNEKCFETNLLPEKCFLYDLLKLQNLGKNRKWNIDSSEFNEDDYKYVSTLLNIIESEKLDLNVQRDRDTFYSLASPIHLALIAAVARDCSIMICFSTDPVVDTPHVNVGDIKIYYRLSLTDLEPKPLRTLIKREQTENRLREIYQECSRIGETSNHTQRPELSN